MRMLNMNQELIDFEHFKQHQLVSVDFTTGVITAKGGRWQNTIYQDVGSENPDGYIRLWCNRKLRMKHRLVFFLAHGVIPKANQEIDHIDKNRSNNCLKNLCVTSKRVNNMGASRVKKKQFSKEAIHQICHLLQNTSISDLDIAAEVGTSRATVRDIKCRESRQTISNNYSWPHRGY